MAPLASIHQLSNKYLWNNERTQETEDSQAFALFKATIPPSQGFHGSKHKRPKLSRVPSTFQSANPLQVHHDLGNPGAEAAAETELRGGAKVCQLHAQCWAIVSEVNLEKSSLPTLG